MDISGYRIYCNVYRIYFNGYRANFNGYIVVWYDTLVSHSCDSLFIDNLDIDKDEFCRRVWVPYHWVQYHLTIRFFVVLTNYKFRV